MAVRPMRTCISTLSRLVAVGVLLTGCSESQARPFENLPSIAPSPSPEMTPPSRTGLEPTPPSPTSMATTLDVAFVGDIIFGRYRGDTFDPIPEPDFDVFAAIQPLLVADYVVGNLETPVVEELPTKSPIASRFRFGASKAHVAMLATTGFDAVSMANNHWYDQRLLGLEQGPRVLDRAGIVPLGEPTSPASFRVQTVELEGWRIGFIALTNRTNAPLRENQPQTPYLLTRDVAQTIGPVVQAARADHDLLIVQIHWGDEYADGPNTTQRRAAHALVDAGVDLVIGHHPHVLQGVERYGHGLIAYSLGNFLFENTSSPPRLTGVLHAQVHRNDPSQRGQGSACIESLRFKPAYIARQPTPHPTPATGGMRRAVANRLRQTSERFATTWQDDGDDLVMAGTCSKSSH